MRAKAGTFCMVIGTALVLAALSLFLWNRQEDLEAGAAAEEVLPQVIDQIRQEVSSQEQQDQDPSHLPDPYDPTMTQVEIDGYGYVGYLSIQALDLVLPVMAEWDYERLKLAPCLYTGSTKTRDLVIAAHNYSRHFGAIGTLEPGDKVFFTDMDGQIWAYEVAVVEVLEATAVEEMSSGEYALSLFTCTYGGQSRVTVRCDMVS